VRPRAADSFSTRGVWVGLLFLLYFATESDGAGIDRDE
jgi:hypothetical protein